jgi:hypothetical protein
MLGAALGFTGMLCKLSPVGFFLSLFLGCLIGALMAPESDRNHVPPGVIYGMVTLFAGMIMFAVTSTFHW